MLIDELASEPVVPLTSTDLTTFVGFIGLDSAEIYDRAMIRDYDPKIAHVRVSKMSNIDLIASWFSIDSPAAIELSGVMVATMFIVSKHLANADVKENDPFSFEKMNEIMNSE
jgi:hypothetical protein